MNKRSFLFMCIVFVGFSRIGLGQTNYYSAGNNDVTNTANWWTATDGTGSNPSDFTTAGQIFNVLNGHSMTASALWTVSGSGSKVVIKTGGKITASGFNHSITFDMESNATYIVSSSYSGLTFGTLNSNSNFQLDGASGYASSRTYPNLILNTGGTLTLGNVTITGSFTVNTGCTPKINNTTGTAVTANIAGSIIINGTGSFTGNLNGAGLTTLNLGGSISDGLFSAGSGAGGFALNFSGGSSSVTFSPNSTFNTTGDITIAGSKTVLLGQSINVFSGNTFTVDGTLDCGTNTISGGGSFVLGNTATLKCGHSDGIFGNIATLGANTFPASATYIFNGLVAQSVSNLLPDNLTGTLTIDNAQGVSMNVDRTISTGTLNFQSGVLKTRFGSSTIKNLIIGSGATITGASTTSFVDGPLIMTLLDATEKIFPIGSSNAYRPLTLNFSVGQNVTAEMFNTAPSGPYSGIGIDKISLVRYYSVSNSTNSSVTVAIPWSTDDGVSDLSYITAVYGINTTVWAANSRSGSTTGDATAGTVTGTFTNITGADFTLGNITGGLNPLPVELTSFTSSVHGNAVTLAWKTATEVDNYGFEIERIGNEDPQKAEGIRNWSKVGFVNGAGNSNSPKEYSFTDKSATSSKYLYRLKQLDNDGQYTYSNEVEVDLGTPTAFALEQNYPNPFNPTTSMQYSVSSLPNGTVGKQFITIKVFDMLGREIALLVNGEKESGTYTTEFATTGLASGTYIYRMQAGEFVQTKKMVILK